VTGGGRATRERYVALLRGVNVNGHRPLPMRLLRELALGLGFEEVATLLQSGNLLLTAAAPPQEVRAALEGALRPLLSGPAAVAVRTAEAWKRIVEACPFPGERPQDVHVAFWLDPPAEGGRERLLARAAAVRGDDEMRLGTQEAYILYRRGMHASAVSPAFVERHLGVAVTARNWRTVHRVQEHLATPA
jgi:uncharacterized protein (DUF1697 family)